MTPDGFAAALRARGIELVLRRNRLAVWPVRAYRLGLVDAERDYLAAHRNELKELVRAGLPETTVAWREAGGAEPRPDRAARLVVELDLRCPFCYGAPCIGRKHTAFALLHALDPQEQQRSDAEQRERHKHEWETRQCYGIPPPTWE